MLTKIKIYQGFLLPLLLLAVFLVNRAQAQDQSTFVELSYYSDNGLSTLLPVNDSGNYCAGIGTFYILATATKDWGTGEVQLTITYASAGPTTYNMTKNGGNTARLTLIPAAGSHEGLVGSHVFTLDLDVGAGQDGTAAGTENRDEDGWRLNLTPLPNPPALFIDLDRPTVAGPTLSNNTTGDATWGKNGDSFSLTATVGDAGGPTSGVESIYADFSSLTGIANDIRQSASYDGATATWNSVTVNASEGLQTVSIWAVDYAGNETLPRVTTTTTIDNEAPEIGDVELRNDTLLAIINDLSDPNTGDANAFLRDGHSLTLIVNVESPQALTSNADLSEITNGSATTAPDTSVGGPPDWVVTWNAIIASQTGDALLTVDISVSDPAGNTATETVTITSDNTAPTITGYRTDYFIPGNQLEMNKREGILTYTPIRFSVSEELRPFSVAGNGGATGDIQIFQWNHPPDDTAITAVSPNLICGVEDPDYNEITVNIDPWNPSFPNEALPSNEVLILRFAHLKDSPPGPAGGTIQYYPDGEYFGATGTSGAKYGILDRAGNVLDDSEGQWALNEIQWMTDNESPVVREVFPTDEIVITSYVPNIRMKFNELMNHQSIIDGFTLYGEGGVSINPPAGDFTFFRSSPGVYSSWPTEVIIDIPALTEGSYEVVLTGGYETAGAAKDYAGIPMNTYRWNFVYDTRYLMVATQEVVTAGSMETTFKTIPLHGSDNVAIGDSNITIYFNEPINPETITNSNRPSGTNILISAAGSAVNYSYSYDDIQNKLVLSTSFTADRTYIVRMYSDEDGLGGITDKNGLPLAGDPEHFYNTPKDFVFWFTTGESIPPRVSETMPENNKIDVSVDSAVTVTFTKSVDASKLFPPFKAYDFRRGSDNTDIDHAYSYDPATRTLTLTPTMDLYHGETFEVRLATQYGSGWEAVTDTKGLALVDNDDNTGDGFYSFQFKTSYDNVNPTILYSVPPEEAVNIALDIPVVIGFSKPMNRSAVEGDVTFTPDPGGQTFTWNAASTEVTINHNNFVANTIYIISMTSASKDMSGNPLDGDSDEVGLQSAVIGFKTIDNTQPTVISTSPVDGSIEVALNMGQAGVTPVRIDFSEEMLDSAAELFRVWGMKGGVHQGTIEVLDAILADNDKIVDLQFNLAATPLDYAVTYYVEVNGEHRDVSGNKLSGGSYTFSFTTQNDTSIPVVVGAYPSDELTGVSGTDTVEVYFSKPMNRTTVESAISFSCPTWGTTYTATANWIDDFRVRFRAVNGAGVAQDFPDDNVITANISTLAKDQFGISLAGSVSWWFSTNDTVSPTILITQPDSGEVNVSLPITSINIHFSEPMLTDSFAEGDNITLLDVTTNYEHELTVASFANNNRTVALQPDIALANGRTYRVTTETQVTDLSGNPVDTNTATNPLRVFEFETEIDATPPTVTSTVPADGAVGYDSQLIRIYFSKSMDTASTNEVSVTAPSWPAVTTYTTSWSNYDSVMNIWPHYATGTMWAPTNEAVTVNVGALAKDIYNVQMGSSYSFQYYGPDTITPEITTVYPLDGSTEVRLETPIRAFVSEQLNPASLHSDDVRLWSANGSVEILALDWNSVDRFISFDYAGTLENFVTYTAEVLASKMSDTAGNLLTIGKTWSFTIAKISDAPTVTARLPLADAIEVDTAETVLITFSLPMDKTVTTNAISFSCPTWGQSYTATTSWNANDNIVTCTPHTGTAATVFPADETIIVRVEASAKSKYGIQMNSAETWSFNTFDTTAPTILSTTPAYGVEDVGLGNPIVINFSEPIEPLSSPASAFRVYGVTQGGSKAPTPEIALSMYPSFSNGNRTVTIGFESDLQMWTSYTAEVSPQITDIAGNNLSSSDPLRIFPFTTIRDTTIPEVTYQSPQAGAVQVDMGASVEITFNVPMDTSEVTSSISFSCSRWPSNYTATTIWSNEDKTLKARPHDGTQDVQYPSNEIMTVSISTNARSKYQIPIASAVTWTFTTLDNITPEVESTDPVLNTIDVSRTPIVTFKFTEPMNPATISSGTVKLWKSATQSVTLGMTYAEVSGEYVLSIAPVTSLEYGTWHTAEVTTQVQDLYGNSIADGDSLRKVAFKTIEDSSRPTILSVEPATGETNVDLDRNIKVTFSKAMDTASVQNALSIAPGTWGQANTWTWSGGDTTVVFNPHNGTNNVEWTGNTSYVATIAATASDKNGIQIDGASTGMPSAYTWLFSTSDTVKPSVKMTMSSPASAEVNVPIGIQGGASGEVSLPTITIRYTKPMNPGSFPNSLGNDTSLFYVKNELGNTLTGSLDKTNLQDEFDPRLTINLLEYFDNYYWYSINMATSETDLVGNYLQDGDGNSDGYVRYWFRTIADTSPVEILSVTPENGSVGVGTGENLVITFNKGMDTAEVLSAISITPGTWTNHVSWTTWVNSDQIVTIDTGDSPSPQAFNPNTTYNINISTQAKDKSGYSLDSAYSWSFQTIDTMHPRVSLTVPSTSYSTDTDAVSLEDIAIDQPISVTFSEEMDTNSVSLNTFVVTYTEGTKEGNIYYTAGTVEGEYVWSNSNRTVTFNHTQEAFIYGGTYTVLLTSGIKDKSGNGIDGNWNGVYTGYEEDSYQFMFKATTSGDYPYVVTNAIYPIAGSSDGPVGGTLYVTFSRSMNSATIDSPIKNFRLYDWADGTVEISGDVVYKESNKRAYFKPSTSLGYNRSYNAVVQKGCRDMVGTGLVDDFKWQFTTEPDLYGDTISPTAEEIYPQDSATGVPNNSSISIVFSEKLDAGSVNMSNIRIRKDTAWGAILAATMEYFDQETVEGTLKDYVVRVTPLGSLPSDSTFFASISPTVRDLAGNAFDGDLLTLDKDTKEWSFKTAAIDYPTVSSVTRVVDSSNLASATDVGTSEVFLIKFNKAMNISATEGAISIVPNPGTLKFKWNSATNEVRVSSEVDLDYFTDYTLNVSVNAKCYEGYNLQALSATSFKTGQAPPDPGAALTVLSVSPTDAQANVGISPPIKMTFNKPVKRAIESSFKLVAGTTTLQGTGDFTIAWSSDSREITFTPKVYLNYETSYTASVPDTLEDIYNVQLGSQYSWTFITLKAGTQPEVAYSNPAIGATDVGVSSSFIIGFNKAMKSDTVTTTYIKLTLSTDTAEIPISITYTAGASGTSVASLKPASTLSYSTSYKITLNTGIQDINGTELTSYGPITFTTMADSTAPTIVPASCSPVAGASGVSVSNPVSVVFSETMDSTSVSNSTISILDGTVSESGTMALTGGTAAVFTPDLALVSNTQYTVKVTTGVKDQSGNALKQPKTYTFKTKAGDFDIAAFHSYATDSELIIYASAASGVTPSSVPQCKIQQKNLSPATVTLTETTTGLYKGVYKVKTAYPGRAIVYAWVDSYAAAAAFTLGVIDEQGGMLASSRGTTSINVPAGALKRAYVASAFTLEKPSDSSAKSHAPFREISEEIENSQDLILIGSPVRYGSGAGSFTSPVKITAQLAPGSQSRIPASRIGLFKKVNGIWEYVGSGMKGSQYEASVSSLGTFSLMADMTPPVVKDISIDNEEVDVNDFDLWAQIYEFGSGIDTEKSELTLNGEPVKLEWDKSTGKLQAVLDEPLKPDYYDMKLVVTDNLGNKAPESVASFAVAGALGIERMSVYPTPAAGDVTFRYYLSKTADRVSITIYDTTGDRVGRWTDLSTWIGYNEWNWDLLNNRGNDVANGVYFFRINVSEGGETVETQGKIVILR